MSDNLSVFTETFKIYANEVDASASLKITSLLDLLQNTAWSHYTEFEKKYGKILSDNLIWVITKLKIKIEKIPVWNEIIKITTWAPFTEKFFAYRNFEIKDIDDNVIGKSSFSWVIIDIKSKKPVLPENFIKTWHFYKTDLFFNLRGKIENIKEPDFKKTLNVSYSDIDVNNHTNNVKYIQWILDSIDYEILLKNEIKELEANFISESKVKEELSVETKKISDNPLIFLGKITKNNLQDEVCRVKLLFI